MNEEDGAHLASDAIGSDEASSREAAAARVHWREFSRLSFEFWTGDTRRRAWLLTLFVVIAVAFQLFAQLGVNAWSRYFFDALERRSSNDVTSAVIILPILVIFSGLAISGALVAKMTMQARWREWLTRRLVGWWLQDQRYYRLAIAVQDHSAPEYRIARDVQLAIEPLVDFAIGLLTALMTASAFINILWTVGGGVDIGVGRLVLHVPGFLGIAAVIYSAIAGAMVFVAGRSMVKAVAEKNEREARFLADLTRIKENAESIALIRGDKDEFLSIMMSYGYVVSAWLHQIARNGVTASVQSANGVLVPLIPLILIAPKYLAGSLSLGAVMQVASAFVSVQVALNWFVDNFVRGAEWMASAKRVDELICTLEALDVGATMDETEFIEFDESEDGQIHLENLAVAHRDGQVVISGANVTIRAGEKLLVRGESGSGKSTLVRALAGLWPWGSGRVLMPRDARKAFVPQRPYIPHGTLRQSVVYSVNSAIPTEDMIVGAMQRCGVGYLAKHLDQEGRWDQMLSGGERQRIGFARLLIGRPQIIIMDEATSALDESSQLSLLRLFEEDLAYATVISVGHSVGMDDFHDTKIVLERRPAGAGVAQRQIRKSLWHRFEESLRSLPQ